MSLPLGPQPYLNPDALYQAATILLTGSFGLSIILSFQDSEELGRVFIHLVVGFLSLLFFRDALDWLSMTGQELSRFVSHQGEAGSLQELVMTALSQAGQAPLKNGDTTRFNAPGFFEQAFRLGVWGVVSQVADFFFLLASFLIETTQKVLWHVLVFLFPLGCGVYPVFPGILKNFALYAVELNLWDAILKMIQITTSAVAKTYLVKEGSLGLPIVAVECVAIVLMLSVPAVTHRILSGALQGDLGGTMSAPLQHSLGFASQVKSLGDRWKR